MINKLHTKSWKNFKRVFPWRDFINPYYIMIAEFMLQRTKAEQVSPIYVKFIKKYPDINSLSKAKVSDIKKIILSLGLHGRAEKFTNAAKFIINKYNGKFPQTRDELLKIPGVGEYVAGAIMAVCYNNAYYVIDSNIARFINRYYGLNLRGEIRRKKIIVEESAKLFEIKNQKDFLFALLDFTAAICKPLTPDCYNCPLKIDCKYYELNYSTSV